MRTFKFFKAKAKAKTFSQGQGQRVFKAKAKATDSGLSISLYTACLITKNYLAFAGTLPTDGWPG